MRSQATDSCSQRTNLLHALYAHLHLHVHVHAGQVTVVIVYVVSEYPQGFQTIEACPVNCGARSLRHQAFHGLQHQP